MLVFNKHSVVTVIKILYLYDVLLYLNGVILYLYSDNILKMTNSR